MMSHALPDDKNTGADHQHRGRPGRCGGLHSSAANAAPAMDNAMRDPVIQAPTATSATSPPRAIRRLQARPPIPHPRCLRNQRRRRGVPVRLCSSARQQQSKQGMRGVLRSKRRDRQSLDGQDDGAGRSDEAHHHEAAGEAGVRRIVRSAAHPSSAHAATIAAAKTGARIGRLRGPKSANSAPAHGSPS